MTKEVVVSEYHSEKYTHLTIKVPGFGGFKRVVYKR